MLLINKKAADEADFIVDVVMSKVVLDHGGATEIRGKVTHIAATKT